MLNCIDIYISIPVSGCVGKAPRALLCPETYNAVKTALHKLHFNASKLYQKEMLIKTNRLWHIECTLWKVL